MGQDGARAYRGHSVHHVLVASLRHLKREDRKRLRSQQLLEPAAMVVDAAAHVGNLGVLADVREAVAALGEGQYRALPEAVLAIGHELVTRVQSPPCRRPGADAIAVLACDALHCPQAHFGERAGFSVYLEAEQVLWHQDAQVGHRAALDLVLQRPRRCIVRRARHVQQQQHRAARLRVHGQLREHAVQGSSAQVGVAQQQLCER
ncbi:MAG: hypothetical protein CAPSK01_004561 [Candidatus Accumulibacter vicinus]|uniref:Uncharacterized protein n=1 Tax=Candidatus Accumulibacter vicinus TaxID=2954382 RepID=A0A084XUP8_9PROT|nr:MAG: hypothetical protein CAPSK01_004561 [Candidatus Accumulibacter vicinus]